MASARPAVTSTVWAVVLVTVVVSGCYTTAAGEVYNVKHYGAYGNGVADDTLAIQAAINAADGAGGGTVWLPPPGTYGGGTYLSGSLWLASNVFFNVSAGATLLGSPWYDSYPAAWRGSFYGTSRAGLLNGGRCEDKPLPAAGQECKKLRRIVNVTIGGSGTIDGQGQAWWYAFGPAIEALGGRPCMVEPMFVDGLTIKDITAMRSPFYHIHPSFCTNVVIDNVNVTAGVVLSRTYDSHNTDGIDPENCVNVTVTNSWIWAGDDCMAIDARAASPAMENVLVRNVTCYTPFSIGSGTRGGIRNVTFENCTVVGGWGNDHIYKPRWWHTAIRLKTARGRGGFVSDITYRDMIVNDVDLVVDFQMWYPCQNSSGMHNYNLCQQLSPRVPAIDTPHYSNIRFERIVGARVWRPVWLNCLPEAPCTGIQFQDVVLESPREWECTHVTSPVLHNVTGAPLGSCAST